MNHRINGILSLHKIFIGIIVFGWFWFVLLFWERLLDFKLVVSAQPWIYLITTLIAVLLSSYGSLQEYDGFFSLRHWHSFRKSVFYANLQTVLIAFFVFATAFATKDKSTSRNFLMVLILSFWPVLAISNFLIPIFLREFFLRGDSLTNSYLIASPQGLERVKGWIDLYCAKGLTLKGILLTEKDPLENEDLYGKIPILGNVARLGELFSTDMDVRKVIVIPDNHLEGWLPNVIEQCYKQGCRMMIHNPFSSYVDTPLIPVEESGIPFFTLQNEPLENPFNQSIKRAFDILVSLPVVLFLLPILTGWVWFFQRLQAPGSIFFLQERVGCAGQIFTIFKFRSMKVKKEESDDVQARQEDPRIFSFGRFMRKFSIDEMPQFLNVLKGDMSVVGPRPFMACHDNLFSENFKAYKVRHYVKPGVTGPAQCRGLRGEVTDKEALDQRIEMDFHYVGNWSLWMDVEIIIKTIGQVVFPPKSAY